MFKMFKKDTRIMKDIFQRAFDQTEFSFHPLVGIDDNDNRIDESKAMKMAKPMRIK